MGNNMKSLIRIILSIVLFGCVSMADDAKYTQLLIGEWHALPETLPIKEARTYFNQDGTFESYAVFPVPGGEVRIDVEGIWKIQDGYMIEEITKSSNPRFPKVGSISKDKIISLTEREFIYEDDDENIHKEIRAEQDGI
jgi:hypothetical protein